jgi:hypothetical protein
MAATAWALYNKAKKKLGNGTIQLGVNTLKMQLHTSASNASTATLSTAASVTNELAAQFGYATGGQTLVSVVWTASGTGVKLDAADPIWTATGGALGNSGVIKFAVIKNSTGQAICWSKLTTAGFVLAQNNTLTVQFATSGVFTLN